jgi:hypothetical protein
MAWEGENGPGADLADVAGEKRVDEKAVPGNALIWNEYEYIGFPMWRLPRDAESTIAALLLNGQYVVRSNRLLVPGSVVKLYLWKLYCATQ